MCDSVTLGLKENWRQFTLLVIVNAFVGGMVGLERTIIPKFASAQFGIESNTAILSFIMAFGLTKAISNYYAGRFANVVGRKNLLLFGWLVSMPIPYLLIHAGNWNWVIFANLLLGIGQGLTWSSTIVMKIDLVGDKQRGLAMGLNEFAGYFAVGIVAFLTGYLANHYGVTPYPFYVGIVLSTLGLMFTVLWIKDTQKYSEVEGLKNVTPQLNNVFIDTTLKDKTLSAVTQAGLVNNLNDGMIWGLLPMLLLSMHYNQQYIGTITAVYPTVWGISQVFTGKLSDMYAKKSLLFWGMFLQALAILYLPFGASFIQFVLIAVLLGLGTALVYPTFLSTIARATHPSQRAESIGTFRLWRDLGYAFGAIISGITADLFGIKYAILIVGFITLLSALVIKYRMPNE